MGKSAENHIVNDLTKFGNYKVQYENYKTLVKISSTRTINKGQKRAFNTLRINNNKNNNKVKNKLIYNQLEELEKNLPAEFSVYQGLSSGDCGSEVPIIFAFWLSCHIPHIVPEILEIFQESSPDATSAKIYSILAECDGLILPQKSNDPDYGVNLTTESANIIPKNDYSQLQPNTNTNTNKRWALLCSENRSFDIDNCSFGIVDYGQHPPVGGKIAAFLEISLNRIYPTSNYSYGFNKVRMRTDISTNDISHIDYNQKYRNEVSVGSNGKVTLRGSGAKQYWELETPDGILTGDYHLTESEIFLISPDSEDFSFNADLIANCHDMSISKTDGSGLPKKNKEKIIEAILTENLGETISKNGFINLSTQKISIYPVNDNE